MKKTIVILVLMLVALAGCKEAISIKSKETASFDPSGVYTLVTVNGSDIPATVSHGGHDVIVYSGVFTIASDGTCNSKTVFSSPSGEKINRDVNARYTQDSSKLSMQWVGAGMTEGTVEDETFTMNNEGMIFIYKKRPAVLDTDRKNGKE